MEKKKKESYNRRRRLSERNTVAVNRPVNFYLRVNWNGMIIGYGGNEREIEIGEFSYFWIGLTGLKPNKRSQLDTRDTVKIALC